MVGERNARVSSVARPFFVVTCEHGGNRIPARYQPLFRRQGPLLDSHRGYDPGALILAKQLARSLNAALVTSTVSRLLIDLNRSLSHRALYSDVSRTLAPQERAVIVAHYYRPYRAQVETHVAGAIQARRRVVQLSAHSFTPVLDGCERNADVGLLYDPARPAERALCERWSKALQELIDPLRVRRNYPYRGRNDGLTSHLRRRFGAQAYVGVEIEVNQKHVFAGGVHWRKLRDAIVASLPRATFPDP
ncbi:MAG: N-formylglutamate amidohydrolase [Betaproteobacteria bacterium]